MKNAANRLTQANIPTWDERAAVHLCDKTGFYAVDRFRKGGDTLMPIESSEVGDVAGKRLVHLQCHIGLDTLSLARRGASVTGVDFSSVAVEAARKLSSETGVPAKFVQADVYDAARVLEDRFDIVYVSWGSLNWLPDIWAWGKVVSDLLAPGGYLYLAEQHPSISVMKQIDGCLIPSFSWRTPMTGRWSAKWRPLIQATMRCFPTRALTNGNTLFPISSAACCPWDCGSIFSMSTMFCPGRDFQ